MPKLDAGTIVAILLLAPFFIALWVLLGGLLYAFIKDMRDW